MTGAPRGPSLPRGARAAFAIASGIVFASATPPLDFIPGILLGLLGLALTWRRPFSLEPVDDGARASPIRRALRRGAWSGWLFGLATNVVALRFVPEVVTRFANLPAAAAWLALFLLAAAQAVPWAVGGALAHGLEHHPRIGLPGWLAFALGVFASTFIPAVFPWTPAGGLAPWPWLLQGAEWIGERGVTFVLAASLGLVADGAISLRAPARRRLAIGSVSLGLAVLAGTAGFGVLRMRAISAARAKAPRTKIALLQPGFDAFDRWDPTRAAMMIERLTALTRSAEQRGASLTVWPESAYPYTIPHASRSAPVGERAILQPGVRGPVLTGVYMSGSDGLGFNSAVLATTDGGLEGPYDKRHLLWFGETVPFADSLPILRKVFSRGTGLVSGDSSPVFHAGAVRAAVLNCYEDTLPQAGREAMEHAPNVLVNITNDAWFAGSAEGELHLRLATLRAIEARRDLIRSVNRGPTSVIDASGALVARYDDLTPASVPVSPALLDGPRTVFTRFGEAPLVVCALAYVVGRTLHRRRSA